MFSSFRPTVSRVRSPYSNNIFSPLREQGLGCFNQSNSKIGAKEKHAQKQMKLTQKGTPQNHRCSLVALYSSLKRVGYAENDMFRLCSRFSLTLRNYYQQALEKTPVSRKGPFHSWQGFGDGALGGACRACKASDGTLKQNTIHLKSHLPHVEA